MRSQVLRKLKAIDFVDGLRNFLSNVLMVSINCERGSPAVFE